MTASKRTPVGASFGWVDGGAAWAWEGVSAGRRVEVRVGSEGTSVRPLDGREIDAATHARALSATLEAMAAELRAAQAATT